MRVISSRGDKALRGVRTDDLALELLRRCEEGMVLADEVGASLIGGKLIEAMKERWNVFHNPFSWKRHQDLYGMYCGSLEDIAPGPRLEGATCVELGSGSANPLGLCFLLLLGGARRAVAVDLDPIQDEALAAQALASLASEVVIAPESIYGKRVGRAEVLSRLDALDIAALRGGSLSGVPRESLAFRCEAIDRLSFASGEADFVFSNAILEHVEDFEAAAKELARITRSGGLHVHSIDTSDHRRYITPSVPPLEFLKILTSERIVHASNRLRLRHFAELFERNGFDVVKNAVYHSVPVTEETRQSFVEPWRTMSLEDLSQVASCLVLRRR